MKCNTHGSDWESDCLACSLARRWDELPSASDTVVVDPELLRCGDCDPSFGCWLGRSACSKKPIHSEDITPPPFKGRTITGDLRADLEIAKRQVKAAGIDAEVAKEARNRAEDEAAELRGDVAALWFVLGELLKLEGLGGFQSHQDQRTIARARDLHARWSAIDEKPKASEG